VIDFGINADGKCLTLQDISDFIRRLEVSGVSMETFVYIQDVNESCFWDAVNIMVENPDHIDARVFISNKRF